MTEVVVVPIPVPELRLPEKDRARLGTEWWPTIAHGVMHRDGVFLFDTGVGVGNALIEESFSPRVTPIEDALAAHGIAMADVTGVANCHLHFDHSGQNVRVPPGVPIFVQEREWRLVHEPDYTIAEWVDVPGLSYELLDGEAEVAPGLRLIPTPGHTAGHQSLVVETAAGTMVLAGQAVQSASEWEGSVDEASSGKASAPDRQAYAGSVRRLRSLQLSGCTSLTTRRSGSAGVDQPSGEARIQSLRLTAGTGCRFPPETILRHSSASRGRLFYVFAWPPMRRFGACDATRVSSSTGVGRSSFSPHRSGTLVVR